MIRHKNIHSNIAIIMISIALRLHVEKKEICIIFLYVTIMLHGQLRIQSRTLSHLTFWSDTRLIKNSEDSGNKIVSHHSGS